MELIAAKQENISHIMELIDQAKEFLKGNGVDQWQQGYPDETSIKQDIEDKTGYICMENGKVAGYVCIDFCGEPAYEGLIGSWLSIQSYAVVHRLALDNAMKGKGLASRIFQLTEALCKDRGVHSIKIDTDDKNEIMKHLLQKNGYQYCGTIWFQNSEKIAYEKLI